MNIGYETRGSTQDCIEMNIKSEKVWDYIVNVTACRQTTSASCFRNLFLLSANIYSSQCKTSRVLRYCDSLVICNRY